jgi:long-chain acyl-CoA synthetase
MAMNDNQTEHEAGILRGSSFVSLATLEDRITRVAAGLRSLGVGAGDAVGLLLRNDVEFFEASYGSSTVGAAPVPINWHFNVDEVAHVLNDAKVRVLIAHSDLLKAVRPAVPDGVTVLVVETPADVATQFNLTSDQTALDSGSIEWATWRDSFPLDVADTTVEGSTMIYTSGTTGHPKGVRRLAGTNDPDQLLDYVIDIGRVFGLWPEMRTVITGPMYHSAPNAYGLAAGRGYRGFVVLQARFEPEELLALVEEHRITSLHMVPTMFVRLLRLPEEIRTKYDLSSLTHVVHAAAPCPPEIKREMISWLGPIIFEYYGGTESGLVVGCDSTEWLAHVGTVGKALKSCTIKIVGDDGELPAGEIGEVFMRAAAMPDFTYEGKHEARLEVEREGLVTLGDVGYLDEDGFLFLCDRVRDMIISGGVNIYPIEIEACLLQLDGVGDCAVFGIPDDEFGESIAAAIQRSPGSTITASDVATHVRDHLANYKVPKVIEFLDTLPREDSGKIFKRKLRAPYWEKAGRSI